MKIRCSCGTKYEFAITPEMAREPVKFVCPQCGHRGEKAARRERAQYHFTDGFLQDLQGETASCRGCKRSLHITPVVMLHDQDEKRRFEAVFAQDLLAAAS